MKLLVPFITLFWVLVGSCMCTPAADIVRITGIKIFADTVLENGTNQWHINVSSIHTIENGDNKFCLTYNKELEVRPIENAILEESFTLLCKQDLLGVKAGESIPIQPITSLDGRVLNDIISLESELFEKGKRYNFVLSCRTIQSQTLNSEFAVFVKP